MPERPNARSRPRPDTSRRRARFVALTLLVWMLIIGGRLVYLQIYSHELLADRARRQQQTLSETNAPRGMILDRQGVELARSLEVDSFFAVPSEIEDAPAAARQLAPLFGADPNALAAKIEEAKRSRRKFVWLAREVEPEQAGRALALNLPGIHTIKEPKRYYPNGALAAHVLGFVGLDDKGLGGVEGFYDASL